MLVTSCSASNDHLYLLFFQILSTMRLSYTSEDLLGNGGYGKVFAAKIIDVGTDLALKKARVTNHVRHPILLHEARVLIVVQGHPNIPYVFSWGRSQYFEYLVMELLGPSLEDVASGVGLTQRNAIPLICQMFDALEHVHGKRFIHGDIKPSNFVLGRGDNVGQLYLVDFGFALPWTSDSPRGGRRGTVPYSSLRVLRGEAPLPRDDLESLAYTIAEVMTGPLPWASQSARQRLDKGTVRGADLFPDSACYRDLFPQFVDFACGLSPADDLQYRRWRESFRALDPRLPRHPSFHREDRGGSPRWLRSGEYDEYPLRDSNDARTARGADLRHSDVLGGPGSRSETGGAHGFEQHWQSDWSCPRALPACCWMGDEFDVVAKNLDFMKEPPVYNGGQPVGVGCPPEVMNNAQSDTQCIHSYA